MTEEIIPEPSSTPAPAPNTPPITPAPADPKPADPAPGDPPIDPKPSSPPASDDPPKDPSSDPSPAPSEFKLPDEYKDKPWASKIKSMEDLYKQIDTLDALKGKKTIVPDLAKATEAEREEYYAQLRPPTVEAYEFAPETDPLIKGPIGDSLMKNGVSAVQANAIIKDYQAAEQKLMATMYDPAGIETSMKGVFGDDWKNVTGQTKNLLTGMMTPEDNALIDNLPNPYMAIIYKTLGNVVKAYGITESSAHVNADTSGHRAPDVASVRANLRAEINKLSQRPHKASEKQVLIDQLNDTYKGA